MVEQQFSVGGLHCEGCTQTVTEALTGLPAVTLVHVDLDANGVSTVRVSAERPLSPDEVQAALERRGPFSVLNRPS